MRTLLFLFIVMSSFKSEEPPKYTWKGKPIEYKAWRDSLRVDYLRYCDSLKKN